MRRAVVDALSKSKYLEAARNADQLEYQAVIAGLGCRQPIEGALQDDDLAEDSQAGVSFDALGEDPGDGFRSAVNQERHREEAVSDTHSVLNVRQTMLGESYPFTLQGGSIAYVGGSSLAYELCLAISNVPDIRGSANQPLVVGFERLAGAAIVQILGPSGAFVRTGWPPMDGDGGDLVSTATLLRNDHLPGEWVLDETRTEELTTMQEDARDGGIDIVAYRRIDERPSSLILVANCSCEKSWRGAKSGQRPSLRVQRYFSRPLPHGVLDVWAMPFGLVKKQVFWETADDSLVLDRVRLVALLDGVDNPNEYLEATLRRNPVDLIRIVEPRMAEAVADWVQERAGLTA